MIDCVEIPLQGGVKDGHVRRLRVSKDGAFLANRLVYKTQSGFVRYDYCDDIEAYRYVARCDSDECIPKYIERDDGSFVENIISEHNR